MTQEAGKSTIDNYEPFGPEWEAELMKLPKKFIINMIREIKTNPKFQQREQPAPTPESQWPTEEAEIKIMESIARKHYSEDGPWYYAAMREYAALKRIPKEPTQDEIIKAASKHSVGPEKDWFTTTLVKSHSFITGAEFVIQWLRTSGVREGTREGEATNKRDKLDGIWDGPDLDPDGSWEESFP